MKQSETRVMFIIDAEVLGGTGKFANATGNFYGEGYFNPQNTNDVGIKIINGIIVF